MESKSRSSSSNDKDDEEEEDDKDNIQFTLREYIRKQLDARRLEYIKKYH
jgi:hypothetical protein